MLCDMARVLELRLILRQPSPLWLSFTVEELQIYQQGPKVGDQLRAVAMKGNAGCGAMAGNAGVGEGVNGKTQREISQEGMLRRKLARREVSQER